MSFRHIARQIKDAEISEKHSRLTSLLTVPEVPTMGTLFADETSPSTGCSPAPVSGARYEQVVNALNKMVHQHLQ